MIDGVYILNTNREKIALIDDFSSVIWRETYYNVGDFEIYAPATDKNRQFLILDNYVMREERETVGIIENIEISFDINTGYMITATGRFAKSILDRRIIYKLSGNTITPIVSTGNVEAAVRNLVANCLISSADAARNVSFIELGQLNNLPAVIETQTGNAGDTQTSYQGLFEYTEELLKTYHYGAKIILDKTTKKLQYVVFAGENHGIGSNNPFTFSQEFDTLLKSDYLIDKTSLKTIALCGGEGEGTARKFVLVGGNESGLNRREVYVDGSSNSQTYQDENDQSQTYDDATYLLMLETTATAELKTLQTTESFDGDLDISNSYLIYGQDYDVGDVVAVEDNNLQLYKNCRIAEVTEVQDDGGYQVKVKFEND